MKRLKVIQVLPFYPPHLGGMEQRVQDLSQRLAEAGYEVQVVTSDQGTYAHTKVTSNLKVTYLKSWFIANTPIIPSLFAFLIRQPKGSVVHIHIAQALTPEVAFLAARLRSQSVVIHIRGDAGPNTRKGKILLPLYKKFFLGFILRHANHVIVLTEDYSNMIHQRYGVSKKKITVIPNATSFPIVKTTNTKQKGTIKLLLVGRLSVQKNIQLAIRALPELIGGHRSVTLSLAGDGELQGELQKLAKDLSVDEAVEFCGRLEGKALRDAYEQADIVIQPSLNEGFSAVLLEAMASGKPIIAGDILGTRSIINDGYNGLLIDPSSIEDLTAAIKRLVDNPQLRETLAVHSLKEVRKYSWKEIVKATEKVYERVT